MQSHMSKVRGKNTTPEIKIRRLLCKMGKRGYRLHRFDLPGKPDIAFIKRKKAIFVHGCFWHGHDCRAGRNTPSTNTEYWGPKLARNQARDTKHVSELKALNWDVMIIWECELKNQNMVEQRIKNYLCVSSI
jgi:DNA mismatch endonuclease, patch repair protein